ncbi:MAG: hypothetical protein A2428_06440 [Bdellovibrionales bacterium RIFOXYC1_FULL_54_43]|nr:MAG: hypothetical protein A2428_06440 [Bdellovibrionales bacterium RIFOXYC1_FULL_54_43]OFZ79805.1 MAG: hypothetical protein A2603_08880 [Bdellovibrionales bacterium RIFOXYD1_FULL_55_31]
MKRNILIVDDSGTMRRIIRRYLDTLPDSVFHEAATGAEAETIIQERALLDDPIHLVTLDWMLPEETGYEVLSNIRSIPQFQELPFVIMITAESLPEQMEACRKKGISGYLTKPFSPKDLLDEVNRALSSKEAAHGA